MHLGKRYEPERIMAACQRALQIGSTSYRSVNAILKNGARQDPSRSGVVRPQRNRRPPVGR